MTPTTVQSKKPFLKLVGEDGNAWAIMGRAGRAAKKAGWDSKQIQEVLDEAMEGDYNHLLRTMMKHFECDDDDTGEEEW